MTFSEIERQLGSGVLSSNQFKEAVAYPFPHRVWASVLAGVSILGEQEWVLLHHDWKESRKQAGAARVWSPGANVAVTRLAHVSSQGLFH